MKKLLFFLVLVPSLFAQIKVIGDTTDLKSYNSSGVVILEQYGGSVWDMTGGGLFHYLDSSMTEGTDAFDHPVSGKQWVRVGSSTSPFQNISATTLDVAGDITLENDEVIDNSTNGRISFGVANLLNTGTVTVYTGTGGSATDSSLLITSSSGSPRVNFYGTDGDLYYLGINTSDRALFAGASGGYLFDTTVTIYTGSGGSSTDSSVIIGSSSGQPSIQIFGTDGDAYTMGINTSDAALFAGASGGYSFTNGTVTAPGYSQSAYATITVSSILTAPDVDTLKLGTELSNLIKVRSTASNSDSVAVLTGGITNSYYQFRAVHTDTTITFVDGVASSNLKLGGARVLDGDDDTLLLFYDGTSWVEIGFVNVE